MKITVTTHALLCALQTISGAIGRDQHSNCLMTFDSGSMSLHASNDMVNMISQAVPFSGEADEMVCLSYQRLLDIVTALSTRNIAEVSLESAGEQLLVKGERSKYKLNQLNASEFPRPSSYHEEKSRIVLNKLECCRFLQNGLKFSGRDDVRSNLNGVALEVTDECLNFVSTNGHIMFVGRTIPLNLKELNNTLVIVPNKAVEQMIKFMAEDTEGVEFVLSLGTNSCMLKNERTGKMLMSKLIADRYPDYRRVIPMNYKHKVVVNRQDLINVAKAASVMANEKFMAGRFSFEGPELILTTQSVNGEGYEVLSTEGYMESEPFVIGFNLRLLQNALGANDSEAATMWLTGPSDGVIVTFKNTASMQVMLMPVRL
jgi:DNA polymerase-3 subunit beta